MNNSRIIILSGPSGSGKTTLQKKLLSCPQAKGKIVKSISVTTRPKRKGEKNGRDYFFISEKMFLYKRRTKQFLESEKVFQHYYGTPKKHVVDLLKQGKSVLLCIDVKGARDVAKSFPDTLKIFIKTPSVAVLKKRLTKRSSEKKQSLQLRLKTARKELKEAKKYDYVVVNDNLSRAFKELKSIVFKKTRKPQRCD